MGYLYNILNIRNDLQDNDICFLPSSVTDYRISFIITKICSEIIFKLNNITGVVKEITRCRLTSLSSGRANFKKYDIIHFHGTVDMYSQKSALIKYDGLVILTTHSPKVLHKELIEDCISHDEYVRNKTFYDAAEEFDKYAFERADYIIFPCPGAEEPYYHSWSKYELIRDEKKIRYVPTGILPVFCKRSREDIRREYSIPEDAILLSFVGRHNEVKGYDILQKIFNNLENVYIICCGNIGNIKPVNSNRWVEVGWTDDPYSVVGASDVYMLPNRETYFDIAMLQTLCIGKCSVISKTGGNKEFIGTPGVKLYEKVEQAIEQVKEFINMSYEERLQLEQLQKKEFEEKYTIEVFYKNYKETLKKMVEDKVSGK